MRNVRSIKAKDRCGNRFTAIISLNKNRKTLTGKKYVSLGREAKPVRRASTKMKPRQSIKSATKKVMDRLKQCEKANVYKGY